MTNIKKILLLGLFCLAQQGSSKVSQPNQNSIKKNPPGPSGKNTNSPKPPRPNQNVSSSGGKKKK